MINHNGMRKFVHAFAAIFEATKTAAFCSQRTLESVEYLTAISVISKQRKKQSMYMQRNANCRVM